MGYGKNETVNKPLQSDVEQKEQNGNTLPCKNLEYFPHITFILKNIIHVPSMCYLNLGLKLWVALGCHSDLTSYAPSPALIPWQYTGPLGWRSSNMPSTPRSDPELVPCTGQTLSPTRPCVWILGLHQISPWTPPWRGLPQHAVHVSNSTLAHPPAPPIPFPWAFTVLHSTSVTYYICYLLFVGRPPPTKCGPGHSQGVAETPSVIFKM